jgi:hypothetical protein
MPGGSTDLYISEFTEWAGAYLQFVRGQVQKAEERSGTERRGPIEVTVVGGYTACKRAWSTSKQCDGAKA